MSPKISFRLFGLSCLLVAAAFVVPALTQDEKPKGKKYALLVGVTEYESSKLAPLTYTENDVVELGKILRGKTAGFDSVRVLTNKSGKNDKPTAANIRAALKELVAKKTRNDTVLVALSGHGLQLEVPHPKDDAVKPKTYSYFCPLDADLASEVSHSTGRSDSLIHIKEVLDAMDDCSAGVKLLLMDACRNEMKALATTRSLDVRQFTIPENAAALFSCKPGQKAFETEKLKHGVFFHFVLEGLRGEAKNKRGEVTWARLAEYVQENVNDAVGKEIGGGARQEPHFVNNLAGKSPVLVKLDVSGDAPGKDKDGTKVERKDGRKGEGWIELFNGKGLTGWKSRASAQKGWIVGKDRVLVCSKPHKGNDLLTEKKFTDFELHVEFQSVGNSGVYLQGRYEIQILDDVGKQPTTISTGALHGHTAPSKNMNKRPPEWNTFEIEFRAPRGQKGVVAEGARVTLVWNGEKVLDDVEIDRPTGAAFDSKVLEPGPILLQGDLGTARFRNIRIRPLGKK